MCVYEYILTHRKVYLKITASLPILSLTAQRLPLYTVAYFYVW